jgi:hypothetical protein
VVAHSTLLADRQIDKGQIISIPCGTLLYQALRGMLVRVGWLDFSVEG